MSPIISSLSTVRSSYGFGRRIVISTIGGGVTSDSYFGDVSLLLYGDGINDSTAIVDSSSNNHAITVNGDAQISTTQSKFGGSSLYFDGTGDYVTAPSDASFDFDNGDFTIEFWMNPSNITGTWQAIISRKYNQSGGWRLYKTSGSNNLSFYHPSGYYVTSNTGLTNGTWHHIAVVRSGSTLTTYVDGTSRGTDTISAAMSPTSADIEIGQGVVTSAYPYEGYLDELRITKGVARYTSNFTPPTASFSTVTPGEKYFYQNSLLLYGDGTNGSTAIVDSSSNNYDITVTGNAQISTTQSKFGGSSLYFDGSGDYLTAAANSDFAFDGDFTIEFWMKTSTYNQDTYYRRVVSTGPDAAGSIQILFYNGGATPNISVYSNGQIISGTIDAADDSWHHVALSRSGSSMKLFVDGVQSGNTSGSTTNFSSGATYGLIVGRYQAGNGHFEGYLDDLRITKGVARYTGNFTIPTSEASSSDPYFSNTELLLNGNGTNGSSTITDSSNNSYTVNANGNAQISTAQSKFGGSSMYFDGSGDNLEIADSASWDFGAGDFTIDFWIYPLSITNTSSKIACQWGATGSSGTWFIELSGTNTISAYFSNTTAVSSSVYSSASANISFNQWQHIAVVRKGTTLYLYKDGIVSGSSTFNFTVPNAPEPLRIGMQGYTAYRSGEPYHGYLEDFRVTKGVARYGNFTPPTAGFSTLTPVEPYFHNNSLLLHGDGTNGSTSIVDDSINNHTITVNGNAQISTAQSKFGGASMYFDGSGDYLSVADSDAFHIGAGDFTIEAWLYKELKGTYHTLLGQRVDSTNEWRIILDLNTAGNGYSEGRLRFDWGSGNYNWDAGIPVDTWTHIAIVRSSTTGTCLLYTSPSPRDMRRSRMPSSA